MTSSAYRYRFPTTRTEYRSPYPPVTAECKNSPSIVQPGGGNGGNTSSLPAANDGAEFGSWASADPLDIYDMSFWDVSVYGDDGGEATSFSNQQPAIANSQTLKVNSFGVDGAARSSDTPGVVPETAFQPARCSSCTRTLAANPAGGQQDVAASQPGGSCDALFDDICRDLGLDGQHLAHPFSKDDDAAFDQTCWDLGLVDAAPFQHSASFNNAGISTAGAGPAGYSNKASVLQPWHSNVNLNLHQLNSSTSTATTGDCWTMPRMSAIRAKDSPFSFKGNQQPLPARNNNNNNAATASAYHHSSTTLSSGVLNRTHPYQAHLHLQHVCTASAAASPTTDAHPSSTIQAQHQHQQPPHNNPQGYFLDPRTGKHVPRLGSSPSTASSSGSRSEVPSTSSSLLECSSPRTFLAGMDGPWEGLLGTPCPVRGWEGFRGGKGQVGVTEWESGWEDDFGRVERMLDFGVC